MNCKLVVFGDSWTWGTGLQPNEPTYGKLIADYRNIEFQNYSVQGTAAEHMVLQLQDLLSNIDPTFNYTALFSFTVLSRLMYYAGKQPDTAYVMWDGTKDDVSASYFKNIHSTLLDHFKFYTTVLALQSLCRQYKIQDYYALSFSKVDWDLLNFIGVDRSKFYNQGTTNFLDILGSKYPGDNKIYFEGTDGGHPNALGHQIIAQHLQEWIN